MENLIFVIVIFSALILIFYKYVNDRKKILHLNLVTIYDKMEIEIIRNKVPYNSSLKKHLIGFKTYVVNPEMIDIYFLMGVLKQITQKELNELSKSDEKAKSKLPKSFEMLENEFANNFKKILYLSALKPIFIFAAFKYIFAHFGIKKVHSMKTTFYSWLNKLTQNDSLLGRYSVNLDIR